LTENFAYKSRPLSPMQGQMWYKNADYVDPNYPSDPTTQGMYVWGGTGWVAMMTSFAGILNLTGNRITGLGDAVLATDALNMQTGDARYLRTSGGTVNGTVTLATGSIVASSGTVITVADAPTQNIDVPNKAYVDQQVAAVQAALVTETSDRQASDSQLTTDVNAVTATVNDRVLKTGDTITGILTLDTAAGIFVSAGTGALSFGDRRLQSVGDPAANTDATNKIYVDTAISTAVSGIGGGGTSDGVVDAGSYSSATGLLTLSRTGMADVVVSGQMAPFTHTHEASSVIYNMTVPYARSVIAANADSTPGYPLIPLYTAVQILDQSVSELYRGVHRLLIDGDGTTTTFNLGETYDVGSNRLQVFVDGNKKYMSERGVATAKFSHTDPLAIDTRVTGLSAGVYGFDVALNGAAAVPVTISIASQPTYGELFMLIDAALTAASLSISVTMEQRRTFLELYLTSDVYGPTSAVVITAPSSGSNLFTSITTLQSQTSTSTPPRALAYQEVGSVGDTSNSIVFATAPAVGTLIEVLIHPGV